MYHFKWCNHNYTFISLNVRLGGISISSRVSLPENTISPSQLLTFLMDSIQLVDPVITNPPVSEYECCRLSHFPDIATLSLDLENIALFGNIL